MRRGAPELEPELESLLRFRTAARHLPDDVRARVLARGRTFISGGLAMTPFPDPKPSAPSISQGGRLRRLAIAAAIAILAGAAGAVAALRSRVAEAPPAAFPEGSVSSPARAREETVPDPLTVTAAPAAATHHAVTSKPHPRPRGRGVNPLAEVELLQHAHLAYARRDFRGALELVAEHARQFPGGPLAEECEALRVESLLAAGHALEARRAGAAFARRFPRSVLLPGIEETSHEGSAP